MAEEERPRASGTQKSVDSTELGRQGSLSGKSDLSESDEGEEEGENPRPWYEGMTAQEKAEAKRKFKNRRAAKRWRMRKKKFFASPSSGETAPSLPRGTANPMGAALTGGLSPGATVLSSAPVNTDATFGMLSLQHQMESIIQENARLREQVESLVTGQLLRNISSEQMLYEFKRLGTLEERKLKSLLCSMASFTVVQDGFKTNREEVIRLGEEIVNLQSGGPPTAKDFAKRFLGIGLQCNSSWADPVIPNFTQICEIFAEGREAEFVLQVPSTRYGRSDLMSMDMASRMHLNVHVELYTNSMHQILQHMPSVLGSRNSLNALQAQNFIADKMKKTLSLALAFFVAQSSSFSTERSTTTPAPSLTQDVIAAQSLLQLSSSTLENLWRIWDETSQYLRLLSREKEQREMILDRVLVNHDNTKDESFVCLLEAVKQLMENYHKTVETTLTMDLKCSQGVLTPLQIGILASAQLPKVPMKDCVARGIDPFFRWSEIFESGALPR